jgi:hypothetical protein
MKNKTKASILTALLTLALLISNQTLAMSLVDTSDPSYKDGSYTLSDIRDYAIYIIRLILSLVGTLSLVFFVYGGITFLLSAGNQSQVKKGMDIIQAAIIGIVITFASVLLINLFFHGIGVSWNSGTGKIIIPK